MKGPKKTRKQTPTKDDGFNVWVADLHYQSKVKGESYVVAYNNEQIQVAKNLFHTKKIPYEITDHGDHWFIHMNIDPEYHHLKGVIVP